MYFSRKKLIIISGTKIPDNAILKARGFIVFQGNVTVGKNVKISSGKPIIIPESSKIGANCLIQSAGKILIKNNVSFEKNIELISATKVEIHPQNNLPTSIETKIEFLDRNVILNDCADYNYEALHYNSNEIKKFCNSWVYKDLVFTDFNRISQNDSNQSVSEIKNLDFNLFPNPADNLVFIEILNVSKNTSNSISIIDLTGKILFQTTESNKNSFTIPMENLAAGIYIIEVKNELGLVGRKKLVKR